VLDRLVGELGGELLISPRDLDVNA